MNPGLFLCHSAHDKPFVRRLATDLTAGGVRVWLDEAEMRVGDSLIDRISDGIATADYVGVVLSTHSVGSNWVQKELNIALSREINGSRIKVLPVLLESCDLPVFLQDKFYADFRSHDRYGISVHLLLRSMGVSPASDDICSSVLTLERLRTFLASRFPDREQSDWNDHAHLLEQLDEIDVTTVEGLDDLLWRGEPALRREESGLLHRIFGQLSSTGATRSAMWSVDWRAADTCIGGRQTFHRFHQFVRTGDRAHREDAG